MCLAIPMEIVERGECDGTVELGGVRRRISLMLCPEAQLGEFVLVHAGYALTVIDKEEAAKTLALLEQLDAGDKNEFGDAFGEVDAHGTADARPEP
jgi:hydrogenase expression/formation protein HypC